MYSDTSAKQAEQAEQAEHGHSVAKLYDKLFSFEVKKATAAYPIHKKLTFPQSADATYPVSDIYHWLGQELPIADSTQVLDAGCGVGFGCQTLTNYCRGQISGISLSADEIVQAQRFASDAGLSNVGFEQGSFEELPANSYDCILMVESLKHCSDLDKALASVSRALQPGGAVYVVEDVYQGEDIYHQSDSDEARQSAESSLNKQLCADWHLKKLWNIADIESSARQAGLSCTIKSDLTPLMQEQNKFVLKARMALFSALSRVSGSSVFPVYRGGFILDWLYAQNQMRYQVLELQRVTD